MSNEANGKQTSWITNGDFETGKLDPWVRRSDESVRVIEHEGGWVLRLEPGYMMPVWQSFSATTPPGKNVAISFRARTVDQGTAFLTVTLATDSVDKFVSGAAYVTPNWERHDVFIPLAQLGNMMAHGLYFAVYDAGGGRHPILIDDVEVVIAGGNLITNPEFLDGLAGWDVLGDHVKVREYRGRQAACFDLSMRGHVLQHLDGLPPGRYSFSCLAAADNRYGFAIARLQFMDGALPSAVVIVGEVGLDWTEMRSEFEVLDGTSRTRVLVMDIIDGDPRHNNIYITSLKLERLDFPRG